MICGRCNAEYTPWREQLIGQEQPDPCIGYVPGISWACCGHGNPEAAYLVYGKPHESVAFRCTTTLRGRLARVALGAP